MYHVINEFLTVLCDFWAFLSSKQTSVNKYFSRLPNAANLAISASSMSDERKQNLESDCEPTAHVQQNNFEKTLIEF